MYKLKKEKFLAIDNAFLVLKEDPNSKSAIQIIEDSLNDCFMCNFKVNIISPTQLQENFKLFVMSVYPEISTTDKIINAVITNKETKVIEQLWKTNKSWTIEVDKRLFDDSIINLSNKELTSILLHEIGHVVYSNSIPTRVSIIVRYEIAKTKAQNKFLMKDRMFSRIMSLPILDACTSDGKRDRTSIREEVKADAFVKKVGYVNELTSVLTKLSNNKYYPNTNTIDDKIKKTSEMSVELVDQLRQRQDALAKNSLLKLKESVDSEYTTDVLNTIIETFSENVPGCNKQVFIESMIDKAINNGIDETFYESFLFGTKHLKKINQMELDYAAIKMNEIKTETDKMMLVTYLHSKLDMIEYYISILEDEKLSRKYTIPHSIAQLYDMKKKVELMINETIKYKIPDYRKKFYVTWPDKYQG